MKQLNYISYMKLMYKRKKMCTGEFCVNWIWSFHFLPYKVKQDSCGASSSVSAWFCLIKELWITDNSLTGPLMQAAYQPHTAASMDSSIPCCIQAAFSSVLRAKRMFSCFYTLTDLFPPGTEWEMSESSEQLWRILYFTRPTQTGGRHCRTTLTWLCVSLFSSHSFLQPFITQLFCFLFLFGNNLSIPKLFHINLPLHFLMIDFFKSLKVEGYLSLEYHA